MFDLKNNDEPKECKDKEMKEIKRLDTGSSIENEF